MVLCFEQTAVCCIATLISKSACGSVDFIGEIGDKLLRVLRKGQRGFVHPNIKNLLELDLSDWSRPISRTAQPD